MEKNNSQREIKTPLKIFNEALEYFDRFNGSEEIDIDEPLSLDGKRLLLQELMLYELDNLKEIIGNDPDLKIKAMNEKEKKVFRQFVNYYSSCPICNQRNHVTNLKRLYINEDKMLIEILAKLMEKKNNFKKYHLRFGIPCCNCFKKFFNEE